MKTKPTTINGLNVLDVQRYARETAEEYAKFNPAAFAPFTEAQAKSIKAALIYYAEIGAKEAFEAIARNQ